MSFESTVFVLQPVNVPELFWYAQDLLAEHDPQGRGSRKQMFTATATDTQWVFANDPGQDLPAALAVTYRPDGHLRPQQQDQYTPASYADLRLETFALRGFGPNEMDPEELHAVLITGLSAWLDQRKIDWAFYTDATEQVHSGVDRYRQLQQMSNPGIAAAEKRRDHDHGDKDAAWDCEAYGPDGTDVGALCFFTRLGPRACRDQAECAAAMADERRRAFRRINELAAAGDEAGAYLADEFTSPEQLLGGAGQ